MRLWTARAPCSMRLAPRTNTRTRNWNRFGRRGSMAEARGTILVVDDDVLNRTLLATNLEEQDYTVDTAEDGREAMERLRAGSFDVVLLDILMPVMDGYQALAEIKGDPSLQHLPVIVISGVDEIDSVVRCIEMGATDYLPKPFEPSLLRAYQYVVGDKAVTRSRTESAGEEAGA